MITELPDPVCECGSTKYRTWCQQQRINEAGERVWTTKAEREANPNLKESDWQHCLWLNDDTWIECAKCKVALTKEHVDKVWADWRARHPEWKPGPFRIFEEPGVVVVNDYAVSVIEINHDEPKEKLNIDYNVELIDFSAVKESPWPIKKDD